VFIQVAPVGVKRLAAHRWPSSWRVVGLWHSQASSWWPVCWSGPAESARPAQVTCFGGDGSHSTRPIYENGRQETLRALHDAVNRRGQPAYGFHEFAADLSAAARIRTTH
jgi:hypothetical protein